MQSKGAAGQRAVRFAMAGRRHEARRHREEVHSNGKKTEVSQNDWLLSFCVQISLLQDGILLGENNKV